MTTEFLEEDWITTPAGGKITTQTELARLFTDLRDHLDQILVAQDFLRCEARSDDGQRDCRDIRAAVRGITTAQRDIQALVLAAIPRTVAN